MRRKSARVLLLVGIGGGLLSLMVYGGWNWLYTTTVPIEYNPTKDPTLYVRVRINGQQHRMILDTGAYNPFVSPLLYNRLQRQRAYHEPIMSLGRYSRTQYPQIYDPRLIFDQPLPKGCDGILAVSFFDKSETAGDADSQEGARIVLDFVRNTLSLDWRPGRPQYRPAAGSLVMPLRRYEQVSQYVSSVTLNGSVPLDMMADTGSPATYLPLPLIKRLTGENNPGPVPIELEVAGVRIKTTAYAYPQSPFYRIAVFGLSVLARYRVVIDYRDNMMYLEPPG